MRLINLVAQAMDIPCIAIISRRKWRKMSKSKRKLFMKIK
jgi:hypothetical protein